MATDNTEEVQTPEEEQVVTHDQVFEREGVNIDIAGATDGKTEHSIAELESKLREKYPDEKATIDEYIQTLKNDLKTPEKRKQYMQLATAAKAGENVSYADIKDVDLNTRELGNAYHETTALSTLGLEREGLTLDKVNDAYFRKQTGYQMSAIDPDKKERLMHELDIAKKKNCWTRKRRRASIF